MKLLKNYSLTNCVCKQDLVLNNPQGLTYYKTLLGSARGVMVIVVGNGHGDTRSNPGLG